MVRFVRVAVLLSTLSALLLSINGCKSGTAVGTASFPIPAIVTIAPAPTASLELGQTVTLTPTVENSAKSAITEPVEFISSNPSIVSVASSGLACGGTWDSLSSPSICTPGRVGVAQITASAQGINSAPTTVYVHQHIDSVTIADICSVSNPPAPCTLPRNPCQSLNQQNAVQDTVYQAHAFSRGIDISSSVGQFTFNAVTPGVATLSNTAVGLDLVNGTSLDQVEVTAKTPGLTPVYATVGTATSVPIYFTTCPVQSIALEVTSAGTSSKNIAATVTDTLGNVIMVPNGKVAVPLTWSSSQTGSVTVSSSGAATGAATTGGGATIVASCTPPTCNIGFTPSLPIYPENAVQVILTPASTTTTSSATATVYVTSTGCGTTGNCLSTVVPVTVPANTVGTALNLNATPNSLVFNGQGSKAYLGTDSGLLGTRGLMVLDSGANTITPFPSAPGKVLAVAPDGSTVVVSDTTDSPQQVLVFDTTANTSQSFLISGATAADFSPDSLKAYIIAGSTLYAYSKIDALQTIPLRTAANDVAFYAEGAFAYLAGGDPSGVMVRRTCDNGEADVVSTPAIPSLIRPLPDALHMLAVDPPRVDLISVSASPTGCTPAVSDTVTSFDLGHGNFVAKQLIISNDGSTAYIVTSGLNSILVFNIAGQTSSSIPLANNATPLSATLSPDGTLLMVGASDGMLHTIQTVTGVDVGQAQFPLGLCQNSAGQKFPGITCNPDLIAVKP